MNLSIIVACIPFLKPFMDSLQTGLLSSEVRTLTPGYALGSQWQKGQGAMSNEDSAGSKARTKTHESSHRVSSTAGESRSRNLESRSSDRSDKIIIQTNNGLPTSSGRYDMGY